MPVRLVARWRGPSVAALHWPCRAVWSCSRGASVQRVSLVTIKIQHRTHTTHSNSKRRKKNYEIFHRSTFNKPNFSKQTGEHMRQIPLFIRMERDYSKYYLYSIYAEYSIFIKRQFLYFINE